jgi:glycosyltransferase involved in cell wall biosynthesis
MFSSISLRVYSTLANPNVLGTYFLLLIPLCAAMMLTAPGRGKKLAYGGLCVLMCVCLIVTYSRGCYLGLLFAVAIFLVLLDRRFLVAGIILLLLCPLYLPDTIIERFTSIGNMSDSSTSYRVYIWMGVLAMLKDYWLCGLGPGEAAFNTIYPFYSYSAIEAPHSHNLFLQITCDTGIVGLVIFLVLLVSFYRAMCTALRKETHRDAKIFQIAVISAISGFLLESMTDYTFYNYRVTFLFWAVLALGMLFTRADELKQADLEGQTPWNSSDDAEPRPLRVLNVISDTNIGGAGRCLLNYLKYCDRSRYDISVLLPKGSLLKPAVEASGVPVLEADIEGDRSLDPKAVPVLRRMVAAADPDLVHTHGSMSGRIAARGSTAKLIYSRHSAFPVPESMKHGPKHQVNRLVNWLYADRIIAVSPATMENLTDSGVRADQIDVVMNGVEALSPVDEATRQQWRDRCGIQDGQFVVGILARLEEYKGHLLLLEAARQLKDEGYPIRVLIAGKGEYEDTINQAISDMGLSDTVLNLGFVTEVASFLSILDVQANCSFGTEASSLSLMEGFSIGLPAVVSSYGGNPWMVTDGENGLIFENRNSQALADCLRRLMDDPTLLPAMGQRSKEVFEERFTGEIFARNIESVYDRVCKK